VKVSKTLSIIIPARNEEENIGKCLAAVFNQDTTDELEVIVIDSDSEDKTVEIVRSYPEVKLKEIPAESFGHGSTRNLGAEMAKGDVLVFLNADAIPVDSNWLGPLLNRLMEDKEIAGVFSRQLPKEGCHLYMVRDLAKSMPAEPFLRHKSSAMDFMIFSTVSCAVLKSTWERFPFKDEIIIAEDQEWAARVLAQGFKIAYEPASTVYHSHNYTPQELFHVKRRVGQAENRFKSGFAARVMGFILVWAGFKFKFAGDIGFILFKAPGKVSFKEKLKEIRIAFKARSGSFRGRYKGWLAARKEH
jgi:rhamnosyltransferase